MPSLEDMDTRGQRLRAGCVGRISVLKRRDGLARCRYHGHAGIQRWVGWGVVINNLWVLIKSEAPAGSNRTGPKTANDKVIAAYHHCWTIL